MRRFFLAIVMLWPALASASPLWTKPVFTSAGTPMCQSEDDLKDLLQHVRAGIRVESGEFGCFVAPDGWQTVLLQSDGIFDRWDKVSWTNGNGDPLDYWVPDWALRN